MKKIAVLFLLSLVCFTLLSANESVKDIYKKDISVIFEEIENDTEIDIVYFIKETLGDRKDVDLVTRNDEELKHIIEEKKNSSLNPSMEDYTAIKSANY